MSSSLIVRVVGFTVVALYDVAFAVVLCGN